MSNGAKVGLGIFMIFVITVGGIIGYAFSAKYTAERKDNAVVAQDESMQNTFAMSGNMLKLSGITVKNFAAHDIKKIEIAMKRYEGKPNLMMIWAKEQGNNFTPELHSKLMVTIEKVAAKKEKVQLSKISVVQDYRDFIHGSFKGTVAQMMGNYPSAKAQIIMDRIISNKATKETWKTGNDEISEDFLN